MIASVERRIRELATWYRGLGPAARRAVRGLVVAELVLIAVVERDIARRQPDAVRGPKLLWRVVATQNLIGPAMYLTVGRKRTR